MRPRRVHAALAAVASLAALGVLASGCTPDGASGSPSASVGPEEPALEGCGPVAYDDVVGRAPSYLDGPLDAFPNDHAACVGVWLPETRTDFVPQGLAVRGRTAWVSGYDHGRVGYKYCRVMRVDLRTGERLAQQARVDGRIGLRAPVGCRHGGGLAMDEHGLWLAEKRRLWLLDPSTLETVRAWAVVLPVWGSFVVSDDDGRLGLGGFAEERPTTMHWFDPADLLAPGVVAVTPSLAVDEQSVPARGQGAFHADLDRPGAEGGRVWFVRSTTRCGMLDGGPRHHLGFLPGAEGAAAVQGDRLWVLSESTAAPYVRQGGRPVVPQIVRFDLSAIRDWLPGSCTP